MVRIIVRVLLMTMIFLGSVQAVRAADDFLPQLNLNPVEFYVVDELWNGAYDGLVRLSLSGSGLGSLQYSTDNANWLSPILSISYPSRGTITVDGISSTTHRQLVWFKYAGDLEADLFFTGLDRDNIWNGVEMYWPQYFSIVASNNDDVSPVPVPHAFFLLGTGLVGFIFFRRNKSALCE